MAINFTNRDSVEAYIETVNPRIRRVINNWGFSSCDWRAELFTWAVCTLFFIPIMVIRVGQRDKKVELVVKNTPRESIWSEAHGGIRRVAFEMGLLELVKVLYRHTQSMLDYCYKGDYITLYRGVRKDTPIDGISRTLESWTDSVGVACTFAEAGGKVLRAEIRKENILSAPGWLSNHLAPINNREDEFLVINPKACQCSDMFDVKTVSAGFMKEVGEYDFEDLACIHWDDVE